MIFIMYSVSRLFAVISKYPSYGGELEVTGKVEISATVNGISLLYHFIGLRQEVTGGWHVHSGDSCSVHVLVGDHFRTPTMDYDPWIPVTYTSNKQGQARGEIDMADFTIHQVEKQVIVVHASDGTRIGCGEIHRGYLPNFHLYLYK